MFLLCSSVEAEPLETKINVFSKQGSTQNKENYDIARGDMGIQMQEYYIGL